MATVETNRPGSRSVHRAENTVLDAGRGLLGLAFVMVGVALTMTLFLMPVGIPLALVGVVLLAPNHRP